MMKLILGALKELGVAKVDVNFVTNSVYALFENGQGALVKIENDDINAALVLVYSQCYQLRQGQILRQKMLDGMGAITGQA